MDPDARNFREMVDLMGKLKVARRVDSMDKNHSNFGDKKWVKVKERGTR